jgi:hypothetical protein
MPEACADIRWPVGSSISLEALDVLGARPAKKSEWGTLTKAWVPHDVRDAVVDYVRHGSERTEFPGRRFLTWVGIAPSKFHDWRKHYGVANEHNALVPRDWWLEGWGKRAILPFHADHPLDGYRRLAFLMLDADVVAVSPSDVYPVLRDLFSGIPITERLKVSERSCGVCAVDLASGAVVALLRFEDAVQEVFAVQVLPGRRYPELINDDPKLLENSFVLPDEALRDVPGPSRARTGPS